VSPDGSEALLNAFNWDHNLYDLDLETGRVRWRQRVGHYFAFAPQALASGFAAQGFDFRSAEGYHLYLLDRDGKPAQRFALYGLPQRLPHRFVPAMLNDRIDNFAAAADGTWVAAAGDLGLAVWSADGKLRWSEDWWKSRRHTAILLALDRDTLLVVEDRTATARAAGDGRVLWRQEVGDSGTVRAVRATPDGRTCALLATTDGGRVFVLKDGKLAATLPAAGDDIALSPDGTHAALVHGTRLNLYATSAGLLWSLPGDDVLHFPRFSPDGKRLACVSELGSVSVCEASGRLALQRDLGALAVPAWLPGGDLLLAGWMGTVTRLGPDFAPKWTTRLRPEAADMRGKLLAEATVATARIAGWGNAEPRPAPLTPNLVSDKTTLVEWKSTSTHVQLVRSGAAMVDGKTEPPPGPWLSWTDVGWFAEGNPFNYLLLDTFRTRLRVEAVTLVEDPDHPESWLRDARLDWWDPVGERWETAGHFLSDAATHTHRLPKVVEAARWRIVPPQQLVGNLRLAEIVFHGSVAGPAHPDAQARRPVAVLFDEGDELKEAHMVGHGGLSFAFAGAYSGGRCLRLEADQSVAPPFRPPFGHVVPTWDFEIAEHPGPGQYRYLQFAWKALSPATRGLKLRLDGDAYGQAVSCFAGPPEREEDAKARPISDRPPQEWEVVRVDLWEVLKKPVHVRGLRLAARGGPGAFDQVLLGRTEKDLPATPKR
jgi:outer membrane protein assembly factor BamB